ncbi:MAG: hydroxymethylbilane synthase [Pseudomonadota bacterium]
MAPQSTPPTASTEAGPGTGAGLSHPLRIGTRGSPLAMAQAEEVRARLMQAHGLEESAFRIEVISTAGDRILDRPLSEVGGKGLFTKEIEQALIDRRIDIAVHSMKDVATALPDGLEISAILPREDVRDAFVSRSFRAIRQLPKGAVVGTSSIRRRAQLQAARPDLAVVEFRGNVQTRLRKLDEGRAAATFLACAGLNRLGLAELARPIETAEMLPAVAQGAIGIEQRRGDDDVRALLAPLDDPTTAICVIAERAFLAELDGSCRTPIGGLAELDGETLNLRGEILRPDGSERHADAWTGPAADALALGREAGKALRARGGPDFFA